MIDQDTVEIPADVRDNSETVTDYAYMGHRAPDKGVRTPLHREMEVGLASTFRYRVYTWRDVNPDGQRCAFTMMVKADGTVTHLFHTEYFTRVACYQGEWCSSYASHYVTTTGGMLPTTDPVPVCDHHIDGLRKSFRDSPVTINLSERLRIGQH
jgi:hypothetical protein